MRLENARPKSLRPGVLVPPALQTNETTLAQHRDRIAGLRIRMTHQLARECGYAEAEILDVLGPERTGP